MTLVWPVLVHHALSVGISPREGLVTKAETIRVIPQDSKEQVNKDGVSLSSYILSNNKVNLELLAACTSPPIYRREQIQHLKRSRAKG